MIEPKFISGPPGTGKTSGFLTNKYLELLDKYTHDRIIILSHTNVAADEIRDEILKLKKVKEKGLTKKSFKYKICTIHSYCKSKNLNKELFDYKDHINLCKNQEVGSLFKLQTMKESEFDQHNFYKYLSDAFGQGKNVEEFWKTCDRNSYKPYTLNVIQEMEKAYIDYKKDVVTLCCDYNDMIADFIKEETREPDIDALIVDEAQDSNVKQLEALQKLATNAKEYYMVGDADQTIFEFAGANADYFHTLSKNAEQLDQGYRCGKTINTLCKQIIKPVWDYYGYDRIWKPANYQKGHAHEGQPIIGEHYYLPSLRHNSSSMQVLLDKIRDSEETFLFTYRGKPSDAWVKNFFKHHGIEFAHVGNTAHVPKKELRCHKLWPDFVRGVPMSLKQIKDFWDYMGSKVIPRGKGKYDFEGWIKKDYSIYDLIKLNLLKETAVNEKDFRLVRVQSGKKEDYEKRLIYIEKILRKGFDLEGDTRVKYANIHTVKGLTFDNVIVDLTLTRKEDYFTQLRLKYVAYSRGRYDCWTIASQSKYTLGVK